MLSFLRARSATSPSPHAMNAAHWDGRVFDVHVGAIDSAIALDLDGSFFATAPVDAQGRVQFEFPFAPHAAPLDAVLRCGRDGAPLTQPIALTFADTAQAPVHLLRFRSEAHANEVAIVVPVYNAPEAVEICLDSVLAHTHGNARLIVIDDASPDPAIAPLLARYAGRARIAVLRNDRNLGFTTTANRGIAQAGRADVVLLNADTRVGPNWLEGLRRAAYSSDDVATATAVSDNAGAFSVPELEQENSLPACWSFDDSARALWQNAGHAYPELPTGNGFCMYVRRPIVDAIGALDESAFPQGYGEENDFCQRASARGFRHLIAGNVLVHHARSQSFGHERRAALGAAGMAVLRERWPCYEAEVGASLFSYERRVLDWRVRRIFASAEATNRPTPRVLTVGSVPAKSWHLAVDDESAELRRDQTVVASTHSRDELEAMLWQWLQEYAIEVVVADDQDASLLIEASRALGIPCARIGVNVDVDAAVANVIASARVFAESRR